MKCLQLLAILLISISVFSCKKDKKASSEKEIVAKIVADRGVTSCICDPVIRKYTWEGNTVYVSMALGPTCNSMNVYYDAKGNVLMLPDSTTDYDFFKEATFITQVWTCGE